MSAASDSDIKLVSSIGTLVEGLDGSDDDDDDSDQAGLTVTFCLQYPGPKGLHVHFKRHNFRYGSE